LRLLRHEEGLRQKENREKAKAIPSDVHVGKQDFMYRRPVEKEKPIAHRSPRTGKHNIVHVMSNFAETEPAGDSNTLKTIQSLAASSPLMRAKAHQQHSEPGYSFDRTGESPAHLPKAGRRSPEELGSQAEDMDDDVVSLLKTKSKYAEEQSPVRINQQLSSLEEPGIDKLKLVARGPLGAKATLHSTASKAPSPSN